MTDRASTAENPDFQDVADDPVAEEIHAIYHELDQEIAQLAPRCQVSGLCCRFAEYGHTLFVSEPEFTVLMNEAPSPSRPFDDGATCPWQDLKGRCTAREARPLGCRVYFCDPKYEPHAPEITERFLARLNRLAERYALNWNYAPLHRHIQLMRGDEKLAPLFEIDAEVQDLGFEA